MVEQLHVFATSQAGLSGHLIISIRVRQTTVGTCNMTIAIVDWHQPVTINFECFAAIIVHFVAVASNPTGMLHDLGHLPSQVIVSWITLHAGYEE